jgi:hypothetical protein
MQYVRSVEGRHLEAFWWWDRPEGFGADNCAGLRGFVLRRKARERADAAPAASPRKRRLGAPRDPAGRHHDRSARNSLDWDWRERANGPGGLVPGSTDLGHEGGCKAA